MAAPAVSGETRMRGMQVSAANVSARAWALQQARTRPVSIAVSHGKAWA